MSDNYTCIIIDDEWAAIELLSESIAQLYKNIQVTGTYSTWEDALEALRRQDCDLLFMDISIPGKNALELLKLAPGLQSEIIFVTAHEEYALDAFRFRSSGYLLKPVTDAALAAAIDKALERARNRRLAGRQQTQGATAAVSDKMRIPNNQGIYYVNISDIIYLETVNKCTRIVTRSGEYMSSYQLGKFKEQVSEYPFFQVHRSYIINLNFIHRYDTTGIVVMCNKREIPVSRNVRGQFLELFRKGE